MENGKLRFNGQIMWCKGENKLQWSMLMPNATTGRLTKYVKKAVFTRSGTQATNARSRYGISLFAEDEQRVEQFEMVRHIIMDRLWQALIDAFGYPTYHEFTE
jgi:hypothetical protein